MKKIMNIAHRGASACAHENTVEAFEKAIELGAKMVEFDLRCTSDRIIVLWHDKQVLVSQGRSSPISKLTANNLELLAQENGFRLARFDEVLREFGSRIAFDIELKTGGFEEEMVYFLSKYPPLFPPVISSFHPGVIRKINKLDCSLKTALVIGDNRFYKSGIIGRNIIKYISLNSHANSVHLNYNIVSPSIIKELTELGFDTYIWTVNDDGEMRSFIDMGVNGIITDKPDILKSIIDSSAGSIKPLYSREEST